MSTPTATPGMLMDGHEVCACHGVTSIDNPLPVDPDTLFLLGSVSKTYTATTLLRLVADGRVELEAPVRRYVPELRLKDERAAAEVTVLQLLNHTAGLDWGLFLDTGEGDDALAAYVAKMTALELIAPPGTRASYSQAGYNLAGRIVEKVTGLTFERAVASLVFEPLGLSHSFFARDDVMTRRFAVGHDRGRDGTLSVARLWKGWRGDSPGGGLASSVADQLRWARFHFNQAVVRWALQTLLGVTDRDPAPLPYDETRAREVVGRYENEVMTLTIGTVGAGLRLEVLMKPQIRAALSKEKEVPPDHAPFEFGLLPGDGDEYVITSGAFRGQRGCFTRDESGAVVGVDLAGRLFTRVRAASR
ncbi:MAG TPA: serine hydrolase domain-containing protein [Chloroflexota bacterium]|nr:serine hydrolase domain-containing protein [Chloroflexota bacterium]